MTNLSGLRPIAYQLPGPGVHFRARLDWSRAGWTITLGLKYLAKEGAWADSPPRETIEQIRRFDAQMVFASAEAALAAWELAQPGFST